MFHPSTHTVELENHQMTINYVFLNRPKISSDFSVICECTRDTSDSRSFHFPFCLSVKMNSSIVTHWIRTPVNRRPILLKKTVIETTLSWTPSGRRPMDRTSSSWNVTGQVATVLCRRLSRISCKTRPLNEGEHDS